MSRSKPSAAVPKSTFSSAFGEGIVIIELAPENKKYYIHRALLTEHSEYFHKALQGPWKEAQDGVIRLEDVDYQAFNLLVEWLYTQKLPLKVVDWERVLENQQFLSLGEERLLPLIKAYMLGDRFLIEPFRCQANNVFVDLLYRTSGTYWCREAIKYAFANIPSDRIIVQFLADDHCQKWDESSYLHALDVNITAKLPPKFLLRALQRMHQMSSQGLKELPMADWCYYEHESEEEKQSCKKKHMRYDERLDYGKFE